MRAIRCVLAAVLAGAVSLVGGCATILSGTNQEIQVTSDPAGATVTTEANAVFTTPARVKLTRADNHTLLVSSPGYHTARVHITKEFNAATLGNIILGGVVGAVADYASGAMAKLTPTEAHVKLEACSAGMSPEIRDWNPPPKAGAKTPEPAAGATPEGESPKPKSPSEDTYKPSKAKQG